AFAFGDAPLQFGAEVADEALNRPGSCVAKGADGVTFDLLGNFEQRVDLVDLGFTLPQPLHHAPHPAGAFAARSALAAGLVLVEVADAADRAGDVRRLVHHDDAGCAETRAEGLEPVEVHRRIHDLLGRDQRNRRAARNHRQQVIPSTADAAAVLLNQLLERDAHRLFDDARPLDMAADLDELGALVVLASEGAEPRGPAPQDRRDDRDALDVVDGRRAAVEARAGRKRRLQARLAFLAFEAFDHRGLFAADVSARAAVHENVEVVARSGGVLAQQASVVGLGHGREQRLGLADELAADVDVSRPRAHREAGYQRAFDQLVRIVADDLAILARTR